MILVHDSVQTIVGRALLDAEYARAARQTAVVFGMPSDGSLLTALRILMDRSEREEAAIVREFERHL